MADRGSAMTPTIEEAARQWGNGVSRADVAAYMNMSIAKFKQLTRRHRDLFGNRKGGQKKISDDEINRYVALWNTGLKTKEIAETLGVTYSRVENARRREPHLFSKDVQRVALVNKITSGRKAGVTGSLCGEAWTEAATLWRQGWSAGKIALRFGVTRNVVIGIVVRNRDEFPAKDARKLVTSRWKEREGKPLALKRVKTPRQPVAKKPKAISQRHRMDPTVHVERLQTAGHLIQSNFLLSGSNIHADQGGKTLADLETYECRWAVNAPDRGGIHLFCGRPNLKGRPFCAEHNAFAVTAHARGKA
jgi:hypothetical protein